MERDVNQEISPINSEYRRVALVTGGASGIGAAIAKRLSDDYQHVIIVDQNAEAAASTAQTLGEGHGSYSLDITSESGVCDMVAALETQYGPIDVLVNNAGNPEQSLPTLEQSVDAFDRILSVHLRGTFLMSREVGRVMIGRGSGSIVNISSIAGHGGHPGRNGYGAAKAGISAMTSAMACEWARSGVRVNAVAPGYVLTALVGEMIEKGSLNLTEIVARTPLGRVAQGSEIAEAVAFLASAKASFITGTTLAVDGGWLALGAPVISLTKAPGSLAKGPSEVIS